MLVAVLCNCGQRNELIKNQWTVFDGTYKGQAIQFRSTDLVVIADQSGNEIQYLNFLENETIILPGINSPKNISTMDYHR